MSLCLNFFITIQILVFRNPSMSRKVQPLSAVVLLKYNDRTGHNNEKINRVGSSEQNQQILTNEQKTNLWYSFPHGLEVEYPVCQGKTKSRPQSTQSRLFFSNSFRKYLLEKWNCNSYQSMHVILVGNFEINCENSSTDTLNYRAMIS